MSDLKHERRQDDDRFYQLCDAFDKHVERFEEYKNREEDKYYKLIEAQQANTDAISEITKSVSVLVEDTRDVIQIHRDFQGAARVGRGLQGFMLWLLKWGAVGTGMVTAIMWVIEHFSQTG